MNTLDKNTEDWGTTEEEGSSIDLASLFARFIVYWPLLLILLALGAAGAWTYIRYTPKLYGANALLSIKRDNPLGNNSTNISINLGGNQNNTLDKDLMLISSHQVFTHVVKRLHLYADIINKGSVISTILYGKYAPFKLKLENPDSLVNPGLYSVDVNWKTNSVIIGEKSYPFNTTVNTPFGKGVFEKNAEEEGEEYENLLLSVTKVPQKAYYYKNTFKASVKPKNPELIDLTCFDQVPRRAVDILDTIVPIYDEFSVKERRKSLLNSSNFITDRLAAVENELSGVEGNISSFKAANNIADISSQGSNYLANIDESDKQIAEIDLKLELLQKTQNYLADRNSKSETLPTMVDIGNAGVSSQMTQLITAEEELNRLKSVSGPENPRVLALEQQISRLRPAIAEGTNNYRNNLLAMKDGYRRQQAGYSGMLRSMPGKEREFIDISRQQSVKNEIFSYLLQKREENIIAMAAVVGNSQFIINPNSMGLISPIPMNIYSYFLLGALAVFALFILIREKINNNYQSRSEIEQDIKAPILGELLENVPKKGEEKQTIMVNPLKANIIGEQFREIRTNLMYLGVGGDNKVLLVTSSIPGEGKTFVSINIAASLASTGKKVALLGFDLRKGKLGELCGVQVVPGICNYLVGQANLAKICQKMEDFNTLDVLPEGLRPPNPAELMLNERMEKLMQELRFHYDYIVIDSPPIGSVTDARILAKYAFATLYIMRHQYTPRSYFSMIREAYNKKRLPNLAIVLNGIKKHSFMGYSYGNGHASGYGYGYGYVDGTRKVTES
jgi:capsular exopolysaccharide synthesis family protein